MDSSGNFHGPVDPSSISSSLLNRVRTRDGEAWRKLVELYGTLVYRWCRQAGFQPTDAADMVQEVFLTVLYRIDGFHRTGLGDSFRGWLWTIARSRMVDHYRQRLIVPRGGEAGGMQDVADREPGPVEEVHLPGERTRLMSRILPMVRGDFSPTTWQAFWRTAVDGQPSAEVARELGISDNAVRQAKFRVLSRLREELDSLL